MNSESLIIHNIVNGFNLNYEGIYWMSTAKMGVFGLFWFIFSCLTYGSSVPSGPFLSAMLVGCSVGVIYENTRLLTFNLD
jgi:H+/Cl- antiporter ClcA